MTHLEMPLEENINRLKIEGDTARNVDEAIVVLHSSPQSLADSHPEKRMRSAYQSYEEQQLVKLKQEHPTLRLSQLKQMIKRDWMKAPENPFNKPTKAYNDDRNTALSAQKEESDEESDNENH